MQRIDVPCGQSPSFISAWMLEQPAVCDELIRFFEDHKAEQNSGAMAGGVDAGSKKSMDLSIKPKDIERPDHAVFNGYLKQLHACYADYLAQWPFLATCLKEAEIGTFNVQRYDAGGHFAKVHSERASIATSHRVLVWMTYLNDVEDGGHTHFTHFGLDVKPQRGKTLIWPAEWTHAHRGNVVNSGTKYIITGWMHFPTVSRNQPR